SPLSTAGGGAVVFVSAPETRSCCCCCGGGGGGGGSAGFACGGGGGGGGSVTKVTGIGGRSSDRAGNRFGQCTIIAVITAICASAAATMAPRRRWLLRASRSRVSRKSGFAGSSMAGGMPSATLMPVLYDACIADWLSPGQ